MVAPHSLPVCSRKLFMTATTFGFIPESLLLRGHISNVSNVKRLDKDHTDFLVLPAFLNLCYPEQFFFSTNYSSAGGIGANP